MYICFLVLFLGSFVEAQSYLVKKYDSYGSENPGCNAENLIGYNTIGRDSSGTCKQGFDGFYRVDCDVPDSSSITLQEFVDETACNANSPGTATDTDVYSKSPTCTSDDERFDTEYFCDLAEPTDALFYGGVAVGDADCAMTGIVYMYFWWYRCMPTQNGMYSIGVTTSNVLKLFKHENSVCLPSTRLSAAPVTGTDGECSGDIGMAIFENSMFKVKVMGIGDPYCPTGTDGNDCEICQCDGEDSTTTAGCNGNGECIRTETCECDENYLGDYCGVTTCNDLYSNTTEACSGDHGTCIGYEECDCETGWDGDDCEIEAAMEGKAAYMFFVSAFLVLLFFVF